MKRITGSTNSPTCALVSEYIPIRSSGTGMCDGRLRQKSTAPPPPIAINLRVVMFVETGADLDNPPFVTGGCKLTRTEVVALVSELVNFGNNAAPGLQFFFDPNDIEKLESDCLDVLPPPFVPCFSACSLTGVPDNCPRRIDQNWFLANVVNHAAGGPAGLQQRDNYVADRCTVNIYFVGNVLGTGGEVFRGATVIPNQLGFPDHVLVNDGAFIDDSAPADFFKLRDARTLVHEVGCHWLQADSTHPDTGGTCPNNLCISAGTFDACLQAGAYPDGKRPTGVPTAVQQATVNRLTLECGP
jgi:hypothetical protein